jgi:hypothetical protein
MNQGLFYTCSWLRIKILGSTANFPSNSRTGSGKPGISKGKKLGVILSGVGSRKSGVVNTFSDSSLRSSDFRLVTYRSLHNRIR